MNDQKSPWTWVIVLALPVLVWALWAYPFVVQKEPGQVFIYHFSWWKLFKFGVGFYGLYVFPGLFLFHWTGRRWPYNPWISPHRFFLAFLWGGIAHVLAALFQKYLQLPYHPVVVLVCLGVSYGILAWPFRKIKFLLVEERPFREYEILTWACLIFTLVLGMDLILRARASSLSLMGDGFPHMIYLLATLIDGPFPDSLPFFSTFVLNVHPLGFHAMGANLITLLPGTEAIDVLRYFSATFLPCLLICLFAFLKWVTGSRSLGALCALAIFFVGGGGMSTSIPIAFFPWYWAVGWCFSLGVFYLILRDEFQSRWVSFWAGVVLGIGVLLTPMSAFRMGAILVFFFLLELIRRVILRESLRDYFTGAILVGFGAALPLCIWMVPMVLRYGWEETYSYDYILKNFKDRAPRGIRYIRYMKESNYNLVHLYTWTKVNAGLFPLFFVPLGILALVRKWRDMISPLLVGWLFAMSTAAIWGYLTNPYRYFEYFFLGLIVLGALGLGWVYKILSERWRPLILLAVLVVVLINVPFNYYPKYRQALKLYGVTQWPVNALDRARRLEKHYRQAKREGTLDQEFGWYRGYLWSRQKKVWDIYLKTQSPRPKKSKKN